MVASLSMERENKLFYGALFISGILHALGVTLLSLHKPLTSVPKRSRPLEVVYRARVAKPAVEKKMAQKRLEVVKKKETVRPKVDILAKDEEFFLPVREAVRDMSKLSRNFHPGLKKIPKIIPRDRERIVRIPEFRSEKITNPRYLGYKETMQQKIKRRINAYARRYAFDVGEVYLTFVVAASGKLLQVKVVESKTNANAAFREACLRSVRESSPFPPFPQDLAYPELPFKILITSREAD